MLMQNLGGQRRVLCFFFRNGLLDHYSVLSNRARIREQIPGITGIRVRIAMRGVLRKSYSVAQDTMLIQLIIRRKAV